MNNLINEKAELNKRIVTNNQISYNNHHTQYSNIQPTRHNIESNINTKDYNLLDNHSINNFTNMANTIENNTYSKHFNKINKELDGNLQKNFTSNMNKVKEEKLSPEFDTFKTAKLPADVSPVILKNLKETSNNNLFPNDNQISNDSQNHQLSNKSSPFPGYPKFSAEGGNAPNIVSERAQNYPIDDPDEAKSNVNFGNKNFGFNGEIEYSNNTNTPKRNNNNSAVDKDNQNKVNVNNNNYDTNGFEFTGFNDVKVDSFKEFADKKGDDFFKSEADFQANWDDF